ncbi:MAG: alpha/beta hydrolase [Clostridiales bacterium]|nr:alpha/beta hydrolase [Clostridiales bacterium]
MIHETINFTEDGRVNLQTYIPDVYREDIPLRPAMIACPGGGWEFHGIAEGEGVALTFVEEGYAGFVLNYSLGEHASFPNPLVEISWAIKTVREHASEWHIDPDKIVISGFSAGATVAALSATQWMDARIVEALGGESSLYRPNAAVLAYGVYDMSTIFSGVDLASIPKKVAIEQGMKMGFTLGQIVANLTQEVNVVNYVTKDTVPTFFFQSITDEFVPVSNSLKLAEKLDQNKVPFEMHIFGSGRHGMSVNNKLVDPENDIDASASQWVPLCLKWLEGLLG